MDALVEQINQQSKTQGEKGAATDDRVGPLRIRLHRAIEVMQQGLVERDTEVCRCFLSYRTMHHTSLTFLIGHLVPIAYVNASRQKNRHW